MARRRLMTPCHAGLAPGHRTIGETAWSRMTILRIDHVGIAVADLDAAIAFYQEKFGILSVHEEVNEEQGVREAMLAVGDGSTRIQLLAPLNEPPPSPSSWTETGPACSSWPTPWTTSRRPRPSCGARACGCSTTAAPRYGGLPGQLRPSQGRRWCADRTGRAGCLALSVRPVVTALTRGSAHDVSP